MLVHFMGNTEGIRLLGCLISFALTFIFLKYNSKFLPTDKGRAYAHEGSLSKGKPRGAGIVFVCAFAVAALLCGQLNTEICAYILLILLCMLTGYLDDRSANPWNEYKKGALDVVVAALVSAVYLIYNGSTVEFMMFGNAQVHFNPLLLGFILMCIVWGSINVTNCADGVDGLSATLAIISIGTLYLIQAFEGEYTTHGYFSLIFIACLLAYLWYNATPSLLMMGDAGSRAMGLFIAIAVFKTGDISLYIPIAIVLILDGGLGLVKVALLRFFKIRILTKIRTPLHDQVRKNMGWSNTQCVYRFAIIQIMVNLAVLYLVG